MKKWQIIATAVCLALLIAAPALAFETVFKGYYEAWGVSHKGQNLTPDEPNKGNNSATNSWFEQKLDTNMIFKITDNTTLVTRFKALQEKWGTNEYDPKGLTTYAGGSNFNWEEAFMVVKTKIGGFVIGRMPDGPWGTTFQDTTDPADRFNWVIPIDNWKFAFTYEKWHEFDSTGSALNADPYTQSDSDNDKYYLSAQFKDENMRYGLLGAYYRVQTLQDLGNSYSKGWYDIVNPIVTPASPAYIPTYQRPIEAEIYVLTPYIEASFGPLDITAEGLYAWGTGKYSLSSQAQGPTNPLGGKDRDVKVYSYWLEGKYHMGPFALSGGWAHRSGDVIGQDDDDEFTSGGYIESGGDWEKMFILTNYWHAGLYNSLGGPALGDNNNGNYGMGNLAGQGAGANANQSQTSVNGYQMLYLGAEYSPMEDVTIEFLWAMSKADKVMDRPAQTVIYPIGAVALPAEKWDDDHGMEYDLNVRWKIYDNVTYRFTAAYLDAGDYWKQGDSTKEIEDLFSIFNMITLSF